MISNNLKNSFVSASAFLVLAGNRPDTVMQQEDNGLKELEALQKFIPFAPSETSYRMGWKGMQAVRYRRVPASGELNLPPVSLHAISLALRPPEKFYLRSEGLKLDTPPSTGSIRVSPAGVPS